MDEILVDVEKCLGCSSCEMACAINRDSVEGTLFGAALSEPKPQPRVKVHGDETFCLPVQCRHCEDAPCLSACPSGALYRDQENGTVALDVTQCVGCWMCVSICPFGAVKSATSARVAFKCDRCVGMERPSCVEACPTGALEFNETKQVSVIADTHSKVVVEQVSNSLSKAEEHACNFWEDKLKKIEMEED